MRHVSPRFSRTACLLRRVAPLRLVALASLSSAPFPAHGFIEEPHTSPRQSSVHYALVRALSVCAGYDAYAETVATYSQLTDSLEVDGLNGSICGATLPPTPDNPIDAAQSGALLEDLVSNDREDCRGRSHLAFPARQYAAGEACFTDRFQGYSAFFHAPSPEALEVLGSWAFDPEVPLRGGRFAAYGGAPSAPLSWRCIAQWPDEIIDTGQVDSGSLEALGIYLHALADTGSHSDCYAHATSSYEPLDVPTHHGVHGEDLCALMHHADELETFSSDLNEAPLYRTLSTTLGAEAMMWLYGPVLPYDQYYDFPGLYGTLLSWRSAHPELFQGLPAPVPMDLTNLDYQAILEMTQAMFIDNREAGFNRGGPARLVAARKIEDYCRLAILERP